VDIASVDEDDSDDDEDCEEVDIASVDESLDVLRLAVEEEELSAPAAAIVGGGADPVHVWSHSPSGGVASEPVLLE